MKVIKNILKFFIIVLFIIIPICLMLYSMFIDFLGCYLIINNNPQIDMLLKKEGYSDAKIIFLDTTAGDDEHITMINKNFSLDDGWISVDYSELVEYIKTNGGYIEDMGRIYDGLNDDECTELLNILDKENK